MFTAYHRLDDVVPIIISASAKALVTESDHLLGATMSVPVYGTLLLPDCTPRVLLSEPPSLSSVYMSRSYCLTGDELLSSDEHNFVI
jgi:hypothetical protein